jgi:acyl-CoA-binding protein
MKPSNEDLLNLYAIWVQEFNYRRYHYGSQDSQTRDAEAIVSGVKKQILERMLNG